MRTLGDILSEVEDECQHAMSTFPPMNSAHEGYAVLLEEVHELWDEVRKKQWGSRDADAMRHEAKQVAAMAIRFIYDVASNPEVSQR